MRTTRLREIARQYPALRVGLAGDLCLDRYFEIDPTLKETSIETGLPVYNITRVRCQPGGAGTILNNLLALEIGEIHVGSIIGRDGEGYELRRALESYGKKVRLDALVESADRRTFTYTKPLVIERGRPPLELNRLDIKNWEPTPQPLQSQVCGALRGLSEKVDALILLDQVDVPETGVITTRVLECLKKIVERNPNLLVLADSRRGLKGYPKVGYKMNAAELAALTRTPETKEIDDIKAKAQRLAGETGRQVFVTLSERGIVGAAGAEVHHIPALPVRGPIDIVGAGDAVTANLAGAMAAGATLRESLELAMLASSVVIHQLGTTGTANVTQMADLLPKT